MCHILASNHPILFPYFLVLDDFSSPIAFELVYSLITFIFVYLLFLYPSFITVSLQLGSTWDHKLLMCSNVITAAGMIHSTIVLFK